MLRWTFEVARPVRDYLRTAGATGRARLASLVPPGRVRVTDWTLNTTKFLRTTEVAAPHRELDAWRSHGIDVRTGRHGKFDGLSWGIGGPHHVR